MVVNITLKYTELVTTSIFWNKRRIPMRKNAVIPYPKFLENIFVV
ncbi:MAG: hypothetical protein CM1200mP16_12240 [Nitrospina sp.]|nr:MAG: hypothetical protein CM1200mP16_12240 [Nitrospina sp.]